jgi:hypothetical protein
MKERGSDYWWWQVLGCFRASQADAPPSPGIVLAQTRRITHRSEGRRLRRPETTHRSPRHELSNDIV